MSTTDEILKEFARASIERLTGIQASFDAHRKEMNEREARMEQRLASMETEFKSTKDAITQNREKSLGELEKVKDSLLSIERDMRKETLAEDEKIKNRLAAHDVEFARFDKEKKDQTLKTAGTGAAAGGLATALVSLIQWLVNHF